MKPHSQNKHSIFAQIRALEKRKQLKLPMYAIIDSKGNVIEKYRLKNTADYDLSKQEKIRLTKLKIVPLDETGKYVTPKKR